MTSSTTIIAAAIQRFRLRKARRSSARRTAGFLKAGTEPSVTSAAAKFRLSEYCGLPNYQTGGSNQGQVENRAFHDYASLISIQSDFIGSEYPQCERSGFVTWNLLVSSWLRKCRCFPRSESREAGSRATLMVCWRCGSDNVNISAAK